MIKKYKTTKEIKQYIKELEKENETVYLITVGLALRSPYLNWKRNQNLGKIEVLKSLLEENLR